MKRVTKRMAKVYLATGKRIKRTKNNYFLMEVHD